MLSLYDELKNLARALYERGIPYAVCGGLAVAIHDQPRATLDIDLLIPPEALGDVLELARTQGYIFSAKPMTFAQGAVKIQRVSKPDPDTGDVLVLDLLLVTEQLSQVWQQRETLAWADTEITVVSRAGLIALKRLRGSGQDLDDIARLVRLEGQTQ